MEQTTIIIEKKPYRHKKKCSLCQNAEPFSHSTIYCGEKGEYKKRKDCCGEFEFAKRYR